MFHSRNIYLSIALNCLWLLACGCYVGSNYYYPEARNYTDPGRYGGGYTAQRLTLDMIRSFGISMGQLESMRFYLENGLAMQRMYAQGSSQVTASGALVLSRDRSRNEVVIPHLTQSVQAYAEERMELLPPRMSYVLHVRFAGTSSWLTFSPNLNGDFVLEKSFWRSVVQYGNMEYESLNPEIDHYLLVNTQLFDRYRNSREYMGVPYSYPATDPYYPSRPLRTRRRSRY